MPQVHAVVVDPSNTGQLRAWDGDEGAYWAENAEYFDRGVAAHHAALLEAAAVGPTDRVLDIGCGTGQTTRDAARAASSGSALGVDLSTRMLAYARARAAEEGVHNVSFEQVDAQIHPFDEGGFDVAISRMGVTFFGDQVAGLANVARALRPGGRVVLNSWRGVEHNEWFRQITGALAAGRTLPFPPVGAQGPFSLADPDRNRAVLDAAGFTDIEIDATSAPMSFGRDAADAYRFMLGQLGWLLEGLEEDGRRRALDALRATMAAHETDEGVLFGSSTWTIRATRR